MGTRSMQADACGTPCRWAFSRGDSFAGVIAARTHPSRRLRGPPMQPPYQPPNQLPYPPRTGRSPARRPRKERSVEVAPLSEIPPRAQTANHVPPPGRTSRATSAIADRRSVLGRPHFRRARRGLPASGGVQVSTFICACPFPHAPVPNHRCPLPLQGGRHLKKPPVEALSPPRADGGGHGSVRSGRSPREGRRATASGRRSRLAQAKPPTPAKWCWRRASRVSTPGGACRK